MRKISLDVNELRVESFETVDGDAKKRGTVHGHGPVTFYYTCHTCPQTQCGRECLSGWRPCQPTDAWTNGEVMCDCGGQSGEYAC